MSALAVSDAPADRVAIATAREELTFGELAARAARVDLPAAVIATPSVETVVHILAALERRRPLALLHPRTPAAELARQKHAIAHAALDDAALVLFTSGSTGAPRGVAIGRAALEAAARASASSPGWRYGDRWLCCLPLAHAGGASIVVRCLAARMPVVLHDAEFDPRAVAELSARRGATIASLVPAQLDALIDHAPRWRAVLVGGAAASPAVLARAAARGIPALVSYGLTEAFGQLATARAPGEPPRALPGVELAGGTREAPAAIRVRAAMLATRYLDGAAIAPELVTADLGFVEHGALHVVGRRDDVIISGGENVHPAEIEAVLAATPGVSGACVFGVPDARWGQLVGAALAVDARFDRAAALARWHAALPAHARPRRLAACTALPVLASGKPDRRAAAALASEPVEYP